MNAAVAHAQDAWLKGSSLRRQCCAECGNTLATPRAVSSVRQKSGARKRGAASHICLFWDARPDTYKLGSSGKQRNHSVSDDSEGVDSTSGLEHGLLQVRHRAEGSLLGQRPGKPNRSTSRTHGARRACGRICSRSEWTPSTSSPPSHGRRERNEGSMGTVTTIFRCTGQQAAMQHPGHARMEEPPHYEGTVNWLLCSFRHAGQHVCRRDGQRSPSDGWYGKTSQCQTFRRSLVRPSVSPYRRAQENEAAAKE